MLNNIGRSSLSKLDRLRSSKDVKERGEIDLYCIMLKSLQSFIFNHLRTINVTVLVKSNTGFFFTSVSPVFNRALIVPFTIMLISERRAAFSRCKLLVPSMLISMKLF